MKVPCTLYASVIAASALAFSSISSEENNRRISYICTNEGLPSRKSIVTSVKEEKFVPKFDGLRFIETLVTAHR